MKKAIFVSFALLFLAAAPANAQLFQRRPVVQQFVMNPAVQQLVGGVIHQFLPSFPAGGLDLGGGSSASKTTKITVDSSVTKNLSATKSNLNDANVIMQKLLKKNGLTSGDTSKSADPNDPPTMD